MDKYAEIIKAMGECAGPDCCKETCPYYGKAEGVKSCRSVLLEDAMVALAGEMAENKTLNTEMDDLEAVHNTLRAERDAMRKELQEAKDALKAAQIEADVLHQRCQVQQNELNALVLKNGKQEEKTNRRSVCFDGNTAYWCGRADALAEVVGHFFAGEAPCK